VLADSILPAITSLEQAGEAPTDAPSQEEEKEDD
jgi:hypothetical protein